MWGQLGNSTTPSRLIILLPKREFHFRVWRFKFESLSIGASGGRLGDFLSYRPFLWRCFDLRFSRYFDGRRRRARGRNGGMFARLWPSFSKCTAPNFSATAALITFAHEFAP